METTVENKAQKGMRTFVLVAISGVGVFLTVSAIQYGYQVWTRAQEPVEELLTTAEVTDESVTPIPATTEDPTESLFEPLIEEEEGEESLGVLDYSEFVEAYGTDSPKYDFNEDGVVDDADFEIFQQRYEQ